VLSSSPVLFKVPVMPAAKFDAVVCNDKPAPRHRQLKTMRLRDTSDFSDKCAGTVML
jgi:hypothetical protein